MAIKWRMWPSILFLFIILVSVLFSGIMRAESADDDQGFFTRHQILRGRYLVTAVAGCADCHSPNKNPNDPTWLAGYMAGTPGQPFNVGPGFEIYPANITPDKDTGIGNWTPKQVFNALRQGIDNEGHVLCPLMPWPTYRNMSDRDTWAIVAYLKSLTPVSNNVPENTAPDGTRPDCSVLYQGLQPLPPYPGKNETGELSAVNSNRKEHT